MQVAFNRKNCCLLARRTCDALFVVLQNRSKLAGSEALRRALDRLSATASEILEFVRQFLSAGWLSKLVNWSGNLEASSMINSSGVDNIYVW